MSRKMCYAVLIAAGVLIVTPSNVSAQPSVSVCNCLDGPECDGPSICVRFDNQSQEPEITTDFTVSFDVSTGVPSIVLVRGEDTGGTTFQWRVWSTDFTVATDIDST